jgi:hypothetical protein
VLANSKLFLLLIKHPPCDSSSQMLPVTNKHKQHNLLQRTQEVHLEVSIMLTNRTRSCSKILYLLTNNEWRIQMISSSRTTRIYDFTTEEIIILSGALVLVFYLLFVFASICLLYSKILIHIGTLCRNELFFKYIMLFCHLQYSYGIFWIGLCKIRLIFQELSTFTFLIVHRHFLYGPRKMNVYWTLLRHMFLLKFDII